MVDITPEQALEFIQSFALSSYSCAQLLEILNNYELSQSNKEKYKWAIPFVRAYNLKGVSGAEQVN